jgi:hypothetical protein
MAKPICPKCEKRVHVIQKIVKKKKGFITKKFLISQCSLCKTNLEIEDHDD